MPFYNCCRKGNNFVCLLMCLISAFSSLNQTNHQPCRIHKYFCASKPQVIADQKNKFTSVFGVLKQVSVSVE